MSVASSNTVKQFSPDVLSDTGYPFPKLGHHSHHPWTWYSIVDCNIHTYI